MPSKKLTWHCLICVRFSTGCSTESSSSSANKDGWNSRNEICSKQTDECNGIVWLHIFRAMSPPPRPRNNCDLSIRVFIPSVRPVYFPPDYTFCKTLPLSSPPFDLVFSFSRDSSAILSHPIYFYLHQSWVSPNKEIYLLRWRPLLSAACLR